MIVPRPYALLAEITYRCPLHCPYCSNPSRFAACHAEVAQRRVRSATPPTSLRRGFGGQQRRIQQWRAHDG